MMPLFINDGPASSLTVQTNSYKADGSTRILSKTGKAQVSLYVEALNFLLKSYFTVSNMATATPYIACLKKSSRKRQYSLLMFFDRKSHVMETIVQKSLPRECLSVTYKPNF